MKLEQLTKGARVRGLAVEGIATVKAVEFQGSNAVEVIFTDARGAPQVRLLMREDEPSLELVTASRPWSFARLDRLSRNPDPQERLKAARELELEAELFRQADSRERRGP